MAKIIDDAPREFANPDDFESQVKEYVMVSDSLKAMELRRKDIHGRIMSKLETDGEEDESGNIVLTLPDAIAGVVGIVKTRRVSRGVDIDRAIEIAKEHDLEDELIEMVPQVAEDAVMAKLYDGELTENEVDQMFPAKVTWALTLKK